MWPVTVCVIPLILSQTDVTLNRTPYDGILLIADEKVRVVSYGSQRLASAKCHCSGFAEESGCSLVHFFAPIQAFAKDIFNGLVTAGMMPIMKRFPLEEPFNFALSFRLGHGSSCPFHGVLTRTAIGLVSSRSGGKSGCRLPIMSTA
eukprot:Gb_04148 [translate_table: standard]